MPTSKDKQTRKQTQGYTSGPSSPDRVDELATMYPAFCTAPIPVEILDELIDEVKNGLCEIVDGGLPDDSLCILDSMDLDSIIHGSRKPMHPFESPFIGMTDNQIRSWMNEHPHPNFARKTFAVLDEETTKNKTCRIGCTNSKEESGDKMITTDFFASMCNRVPIEVVTLSWCELVDCIGAGEVYNRECMETEKREVSEIVASESRGKEKT